MTGKPLGVYGLRLRGASLRAAQDALVPVEESDLEVTVRVHLACGVHDEERGDGDALVLSHRGGVRVDVRRDPATVDLSVPEVLDPRALVHPVLGVVAAAHHRWSGNVALHAGAFVAAERAWVLLADKDQGKSTTLAVLAERGHPVLTDDLVVLRDGDVLAGPRSVDLRPEAADVLSLGEDIGVVGQRPRHRVALPAAPGSVPLGGFVRLGWSVDDDLHVERVPLARRLRALVQHQSLLIMGPAPAQQLFAALDLPFWQVDRPRSFARLPEFVDRLLGLVDAG